MSWREFSPGPDLAEQCLVHGQLKHGAMEFCRDAAMSINVLYGACKLSLLTTAAGPDLKEEESYKRPSSSLLCAVLSVSPSFTCVSFIRLGICTHLTPALPSISSRPHQSAFFSI